MITSVNNATVDENQNLAIKIDVTDSDGDSVTYSLSGTDAGDLSIDSSGYITFSKIPDYESKRTYNFTVTVSDGVDTISQNITIYIADLADSLINICTTSNLTFDKLETESLFRIWMEGTNNELNTTKINWNPILNAVDYEFDIVVNELLEYTYNTFSGSVNSIRFDYAIDDNVSQSGDLFILESSYFSVGANITITLRAKDSSDSTIASSEPITFTIGRDYISEAPKHLLAKDKNSSVDLEWCNFSGANSFTIKHGISPTNLSQIVSNISAQTLKKTIASLTNAGTYYFSLAAANSNGDGKFGEIIKVSPSSTPRTIDLSISKVVFNQSVQIDLDNNTHTIPVIAGKAGVLRIFVNADTDTEHMKVDVELGGSHNDIRLPTVVKEVALNNSSFNTSDSSNKVLFFDINDTTWLQEGTSFYIKLDPYNKIAEVDETNNRYPSANEKSFGFENRYKMRVKLIPLLTSVGGVTITQEIVNGTKEYLKAIFPLNDVEVTVGRQLDLSSQTAESDGIAWDAILDNISVYRNTDVANDSTQADVFYYGVLDNKGTDGSNTFGMAIINDINTISVSHEPNLIGVGRIDIIGLEMFYNFTAHEIGHNHGRSHIDSVDETNDNCGKPAGPDLNFPYNTSGVYGRISKTGFSNIKHQLLEKSLYHDLMTYCERSWISDYTYLWIYNFEKKLDTIYSRTSNPNARAVQRVVNRMNGHMIAGNVEIQNTMTTFTLSKEYEIKWNGIIPQDTTRYYADVLLEDATRLRIPFLVNSLDHSEIKKFQFFVPSGSNILSITIHDKESSEIFKIK